MRNEIISAWTGAFRDGDWLVRLQLLYMVGVAFLLTCVAWTGTVRAFS